MSSACMEPNGFSLAVAPGSDFESTREMYPRSPPKTMTSASVDQPRMLAPPPPGEDAGAEDDRRNQDDRDPEHADPSVLGQRETAICRFTRSDGDQALLLR